MMLMIRGVTRWRSNEYYQRAKDAREQAEFFRHSYESSLFPWAGLFMEWSGHEAFEPKGVAATSHDVVRFLVRDAIRDLGRSLEWNVSNQQSLELLMQIATLSREVGDDEMALTAYRELRSRIYGSRHLRIPETKILSEAHREMVTLQESDETKRTALFQELSSDPRPNPFWGLVVPASLLGFVGSVTAAVVFGMNAKGNISSKYHFWSGLSMGLCCLLLGLFALVRA